MISQIKKKREQHQINRMRNEREEVTTDNTEIQKLQREHCEQFYAKKLDNLEGMDKFLETCNLP